MLVSVLIIFLHLCIYLLTFMVIIKRDSELAIIFLPFVIFLIFLNHELSRIHVDTAP